MKEKALATHGIVHEGLASLIFNSEVFEGLWLIKKGRCKLIRNRLQSSTFHTLNR